MDVLAPDSTVWDMAADGAIEMPASVGLYVHWPWCVRKCPYCDFNSHRIPDLLDEEAFIAALLADFDEELRRATVPEIGSIFLGGGTPSLMSDRAAAELLEGLGARAPMSSDCEITLEANPGTIDAGHFRAYRSAGVNRLSVGVQSFSSDQLAALGRIHSPDDAYRAVSTARAAGFDNLNLDLMHGLPGQSPSEAMDDLEQAIACAPEHLSWYQLTLEPNTPFHHRPPRLPNEDALEEMTKGGLARLAAAGLERYEVSGFALPGRTCRHNLNYWRFGDYVGIGPGAHGKRTLRDGEIIRRSKRRGPSDYLGRAADGALSREWALGPQDRVLEFMLNAMRLVNGVDARSFSRRTGLPLRTLSAACTAAVQQGLLQTSARRLRPTAKGLCYLNNLLELFMPE